MNSNCRCCGSNDTLQIGIANLLEQKVTYFECQTCKYVQTEEPYWLDIAYANIINLVDTGICRRNLQNVKNVQAVIKLLKLKSPKVLDYAGGYGLLTRLLRDNGIDAYWLDEFCPNLVARGFEGVLQNLDITLMFEVFEHLAHPKNELASIFTNSQNVLISTLLIPDPAPNFCDWPYYGLQHGQHVGFYRKETLQFIADKYKKHYISFDDNLHLFTNSEPNNLTWRLRKKFLFALSPIINKKRTYIIDDYENLSK